MNELFEKNLAEIKDQNPALFEHLESEINYFREYPAGENSKTLYQWVVQGNTKPNLLITRSDPAFKHLLHQPDYMKEVQEQFEQANIHQSQLVFVMGFGLGHALYHYWAHRPIHPPRIGVVERDAQVFLRALCLYDFTDLFKSQRVRFFVGEKPEALKAGVSQFLQSCSTIDRFLKILANPVSFAMEPEYYQKITSELMSLRDISVVNVGNSIQDGFEGFQNIGHNLIRAARNPGISHLKGLGQGMTCISVAAGPSLEQHYDQLKELQHHYPIIACDTTFPRLMERGIVPDFVGAVERTLGVKRFFENTPLKDKTTFVGPLLLHPEVLDAINGEQLYSCPVLYQGNAAGLHHLGLYNLGPSSGNVNIALAILMEFDNVIMIGHNLAYDYYTNRSHIKGSGFEHQDRPLSEEQILDAPKVETQDGESQVATNQLWIQFRNSMEGSIAPFVGKHNFYNIAAKGAKIHGAIYKPLEEALALCPQKNIDFSSIKNAAKPKITEEMLEMRLRYSKAAYEQALKSIKKWKSESERQLKRMSSIEALIKKQEKQKQPLSLEKLNREIDRALSLKVRAVNKDALFYNFFINILIAAHVTFEREINQMPLRYEDNYSLKRDFYLAHKKYFDIWQKWLPIVREEMEEHLKIIEDELNERDSSLAAKSG